MQATETKRRSYRIAAKQGFPSNTFAVKCRIFGTGAEYFVKDKDEQGKEVRRKRYRCRTVDIPISRRRYSSMDDDVGEIVIGAIHDLDDQELEFVKAELERFVVCWEGKYKPPPNKPDKPGVGPGGLWTRGYVRSIATTEGERDYRYQAPTQREIDSLSRFHEPVSDYISIVPVDALDGVESGSYDPEEVARMAAEIEALKRQLAARAEQELADAKAEEREELKTPEGQATQAVQSMKKKRGRPPKQR